MLAVRRFGHGAPVVALHGFTYTGEQFEEAAPLLGRAVVAPDLPGHGGSTDEPSGTPSVVRALVDLLDAMSAPVPLLGYSQGGRVALLAAVEHASAIERLILVSATAGIHDDTARAQRRSADEALAGNIASEGLDAFLERWDTQPLTSTAGLDLERGARMRVIRASNSADGLASALSGYGQGAQPSVWADLPSLTMPVLIVHGSRDEKYADIARRMHDRIPRSELVEIRDAGHNPLAEKPEATYGAVSDFLDGTG